MIGPATKCICDHRYKDHNYTNAPDKKVHCKVKGCPCTCFYYVPVREYQFSCVIFQMDLRTSSACAKRHIDYMIQ